MNDFTHLDVAMLIQSPVQPGSSVPLLRKFNPGSLLSVLDFVLFPGIKMHFGFVCASARKKQSRHICVMLSYDIRGLHVLAVCLTYRFSVVANCTRQHGNLDVGFRSCSI